MPILRKRKTAVPFGLAVFLLSGCSLFETRPARQMAYAEAAMQGATLANAETNPETSAIYLLAKDNLSRARSYYRLKNFKQSRNLAVRARRLAEEAEWKALRGNSSSKDDASVEK